MAPGETRGDPCQVSPECSLVATRHILFFVEATACEAQGPTRGFPIRSITSCSAALTALLKWKPRCSIPPVFTTSSALLLSSFESDLSQFRPCSRLSIVFSYFCSPISALKSLLSFYYAFAVVRRSYISNFFHSRIFLELRFSTCLFISIYFWS